MRPVTPTVAVLLSLVAATSPGAARAQASPAAPAEPPSIIASGTGEARATPDRAVIVMGVQSRAASAAAASAANAMTQRAVIDTLVALGVARAQIATLGYNVHPEMRHDPVQQRERLVGYVVSNMVRVELRRPELVGAAIDAALAKGANQVSSLNFHAENSDEPRRQALTQATARAKADAETLARAAGGTLGELLELTTAQVNVPLARRDMIALRGGVAGGAATSVEPGEEVVRTQVTGRWRFIAPR